MLFKHLTLTTLLLIVVFLSSAQQAEKGIIDLRGIDLNQETIALDGEWEFYWDQLLSSIDVDSLAERDFYSFPQLWNDGVTDKKQLLSATGFGTYRLKVILSEGAKPMLYIKHFYSSYLLSCNGKEVASNGVVGDSKESYMPSWVPMKVELPSNKDTLVLDLQIANFDHHKGGTRESILLASKSRTETEFNLTFGYDLLLTGSLIMAGLFFLGLYFFETKEIFLLFFSLFCLSFAYRVIAADDYALHIIYPGINWFSAIKLEYLSLYLPPIFFAAYTRNLFPRDSRYWILESIIVISIVFSCVIVFAPPKVFTLFVVPYLVILLLSILFVTWVYATACWHNRPGAQFAMISSCVIFLTFIYKVLDYVGIVKEYEWVSFIGFIFFVFFQSLILFFLFMNSLKKAKEEAEKASRSKSEFLSMMSHEIRTPMNAVIGLTNYLIDEKSNHMEVLKTLKFSAKNLLVIINDILDFSKIEAKKIEFEIRSVNIAELLSSLHHVFQPEVKSNNLELIFDIDEDLPDFIECDPTRMSQVLTNLISNAVKFTNEGTITVKLGLISENKQEVVIKFEVKDTGIGIEKEKLSEIFGSFTQASSSTTRKFGGTGLGLTITKQLLELQGADLFVESYPGEGSVFYFVQLFKIGKQEEEQKLDGVSETQKLEIGIDTKILVVEDNEVNIMVVNKFLKRWGITSIVAKNGKEAIEKYKSEGAIDLILMDLQMPIMDGYEAAFKLREMGVETPIIALTASALLEDRHKIERAGMNDYVTKPFDPDTLLKKIIKYTENKES